VVALIALVSALAVGRAPARAAVDADRRRTPWAAGCAVAIALLGLATIATAAGRAWTRDTYLLADPVARRQAATGLLRLTRCQVCFTSRHPAVDWRWLTPNPARGAEVEATARGATAVVRVRLEGDERSRGFARMRVDFGDRSFTDWMGIVGERDVTHRYRGPASRYTVAVWLQLRDGTVLVKRTDVETEAPA